MINLVSIDKTSPNRRSSIDKGIILFNPGVTYSSQDNEDQPVNDEARVTQGSAPEEKIRYVDYQGES